MLHCTHPLLNQRVTSFSDSAANSRLFHFLVQSAKMLPRKPVIESWVLVYRKDFSIAVIQYSPSFRFRSNDFDRFVCRYFILTILGVFLDDFVEQTRPSVQIISSRCNALVIVSKVFMSSFTWSKSSSHTRKEVINQGQFFFEMIIKNIL